VAKLLVSPHLDCNKFASVTFQSNQTCPQGCICLVLEL